MSWFEKGGHKLYYEESGAGEPVLLMPGWGGTIDELAQLRASLAPRFRVIAADLPGAGKSLPQPRTYTPSYYAEDPPLLLDLLESIGATPAHLVGFSDGGEYALVMAAIRPAAVRSIVTWGSAGTLGSDPTMADAMESIIDNPIPPMADYSAYLKGAYGAENARVMTQSAARSFRAIMAAGGDISRSRASEITCPALLITGEHDFLATPALVAEMANAMPRGEYLEARGAGHGVHHDLPEWLVETVSARLAQLSGVAVG
jgi:valacyclovir hydrolase